MWKLILIPAIGAGLLLVTKRDVRQIAGLVSIITFLATLLLYFKMYLTTSTFQYTEVYYLFGYASEGITFGVDAISICYMLLTAMLIPICILVSYNSIIKNRRLFLSLLLLLESLLLGVFTVLDTLGFYILFEGVLIPMLLIIGVWGSRQEKITAAYYFFLYTLLGSLIMLLSILYLYAITGTTDYQILQLITIDTSAQLMLFLAFFASFAVKIPLFPFHIWLPQAHVEAPIAGSVLLAGILIKLGSYGFLRFSIGLFYDAAVFFAPLIATLSVIAVIYASFATLRQTDFKRVIAYSSVSHMGIVVVGLFSLTEIGIQGSILLQIAHGLVSSALFILVTFLYDRHKTRLIKYYRGMAITMPIFGSLFLIFTLANIALPLSLNFVGEFLSLLPTFLSNPLIGVLATFGIVLSAGYALFLFNRISFGSSSNYLIGSSDLTYREVCVLWPLLVPIIFFGIATNPITSALAPAIQAHL